MKRLNKNKDANISPKQTKKRRKKGDLKIIKKNVSLSSINHVKKLRYNTANFFNLTRRKILLKCMNQLTPYNKSSAYILLPYHTRERKNYVKNIDFHVHLNSHLTRK